MHFLDGHVAGMGIVFHKAAQALMGKDAFLQLTVGFEHRARDGLAVAVDLNLQLTPKQKGLFFGVQFPVNLSLDKGFQIKGFGDFGKNIVVVFEHQNQPPQPPRIFRGTEEDIHYPGFGTPGFFAVKNDLGNNVEGSVGFSLNFQEISEGIGAFLNKSQIKAPVIYQGEKSGFAAEKFLPDVTTGVRVGKCPVCKEMPEMGQDNFDNPAQGLKPEKPVFKADLGNRKPFLVIPGMGKQKFKIAFVFVGIYDDSIFGKPPDNLHLIRSDPYFGKNQAGEKGICSSPRYGEKTPVVVGVSLQNTVHPATCCRLDADDGCFDGFKHIVYISIYYRFWGQSKGSFI
jgi:hypothetical protein